MTGQRDLYAEPNTPRGAVTREDGSVPLGEPSGLPTPAIEAPDEERGRGYSGAREGEGAGSPAPSPDRFKPTRRRLKSGRIVFLHPCSVCGKPAAFGYFCDLLANPPRPGTWYCGEHRP